MVACGSAHYWARVLTGSGHIVRLMAPWFVKPYVKSNKTDANDVGAICEAVTQPSMRSVPQKSVQQEDLQCQHRVRSRLVACRTQLVNQIRGLLAEYGIVLPQHVGQLRAEISNGRCVPKSRRHARPRASPKPRLRLPAAREYGFAAFLVCFSSKRLNNRWAVATTCRMRASRCCHNEGLSHFLGDLCLQLSWNEPTTCPTQSSLSSSNSSPRRPL